MSMLPGAKRAKHKQERQPEDWYIETRECVASLFEAVRFTGPVHDPACGRGMIPRVAAEYGYAATGSDLVYRGYGVGGVDFLKDPTPRKTLTVNPPGDGLADAFLRHGLDVVERGEIALIVRTPFVCGQGRYQEFYRTRPPALILPLSRRPSMPPGDSNSEPKGGTTDYLWAVWQIPFGDPRLLLCHPPAVLPGIWWLPP